MNIQLNINSTYKPGADILDSSDFEKKQSDHEISTNILFFSFFRNTQNKQIILILRIHLYICNGLILARVFIELGAGFRN